MSEHSKIQWTEATWNPMLGCSKISPGCRGCYAINHVHRMAGNPNPKIAAANQGLTVIQGGHPNWTGKVRLIPERLSIPLRKKKPTTYFVNSLSDLFHEDLADEDIDKVFASMALSLRHAFQVLTKRADRLPEYFEDIPYRQDVIGIEAEYESGLDRYLHSPDDPEGGAPRWPLPLPNVWLGVSVESRDYLERIDHLRRTPAAVRFLSLEPLLEDLGQLDLTGIHWVIVGGESGRGARPMHPDWVRHIREQCLAAGVPFFFKQHGNWVSPANSTCPGGVRRRMVWMNRDGRTQASDEGIRTNEGWVLMGEVGKKAAGRLLDGRKWNEMPEVVR